MGSLIYGLPKNWVSRHVGEPKVYWWNYLKHKLSNLHKSHETFGFSLDWIFKKWMVMNLGLGLNSKKLSEYGFGFG